MNDLARPPFLAVSLSPLGFVVAFRCTVRDKCCSIEATDIILVIVTIVGVPEGDPALAAIIKYPYILPAPFP